jgi:hypothetical protein
VELERDTAELYIRPAFTQMLQVPTTSRTIDERQAAHGPDTNAVSSCPTTDDRREDVAKRVVLALATGAHGLFKSFGAWVCYSNSEGSTPSSFPAPWK